MDIDYFREFAVLAETGNYLAAADKLYLTQSTLTRHIQAFEKELGVQVFDRTTRRISLNEYGQIMLPYAQKIMQIQNEYYTAVYNQQRISGNNIQVGSIPSMVSYGITEALAEFRKKHSSISLDIVEQDSQQLVVMLEAGECDLAFVRDFDHNDQEFEYVPFSRDKLVAIMPEKHPLAKNTAISLSQLKNVSLMTLAKGTMLYSLCLNELHKAGVDPLISFTSHHGANLLDMAAKENGVVLLTEKPLMKYDLRGLTIVDIQPEVSANVDLAYLKHKKLSKPAALFVDFIRREADNLHI